VELRDSLRGDVEKLGGEIGERNVFLHDKLTEAADFLESSLSAAGYPVRKQQYDVSGKTCSNIEVELTGTDKPEEIVIIGAHYDSVSGSPGANDNATGVAATLALARLFAGKTPSRTIRFLCFVNEEPPFFLSPQMGSLVYSYQCRQRGERIIAMLSLETIGYYTDEPKTQDYPFPFSLFYPSTGNFIGFVGNYSSRTLVRKVVGTFRRETKFPSEGAALPDFITGVGWSDHWSFWQQGYRALMVTDTAPFRYPFYHSSEDTPDKVDYDRLARVVTGLEKVLTFLAKIEEFHK
jgi:Zn-dependent M28 family amino/carboxypeptidase